MPKDMEQNHKQQGIDIAVLKTDLVYIKDELRDIKENHLSHIYESLASHKNWLIGVLVAVILSLIGAIANFLK